MITADYLRRLGNLPPEVEDSVLLPHIQSAEREVQTIIGDWTPETTAQEDMLKEAVGCYAMAELTTVLGLFELSGAHNVPKEVDGTSFVFLTADEKERISRQWRARGDKLLALLGFPRVEVEVV